MRRGFEFLVAARYLRASRPSSRRRRLRLLTLTSVLLTAALYGVHAWVERRVQTRFEPTLLGLLPVLRYAKWGAVLVSVLVGFFVELIRKLSIFTTISTFGLFLGTGALVTVLSVMSGFEQDLKRKILGTHAHMVVTRPDRPFTDYREVLARVERLPGVVAATPYITSELMIASPSNLSGVVIKGIDPETIGRVTDLVRNTDVGSLDNLLHPERLRTLGGPPWSVGSDKRAQAKPTAAPGEAAAPESAKRPDRGADPAPGPEPAKDQTKRADGAPEPEEAAERPKRRVLPGVVIGRELAKNLRVYLGDDVNVVSPMGDMGPTGPIPKAKPFRVAAIFFSGMYEYDSKYIYLTLPAAQKFLGMGDEVTGLELKLKDPERTEPVMAAIRQALGPGYEVDDWKQLNRSLFSALKLEKIAMFIALCFIILVAAFSIISNGIMLVMEKGKEVAILKSMGASDGAVLRVFVLLGLYMGLVGTGVGIACGSLACVALDRFGLPLNTDVYYIPKLPVNLNPAEVLAVLMASLLLSLLATLYPAWMASRLRPVQGLRL